MGSWLAFALIALFLYGFWGFLPKIAVTHICPKSALVYEVAGGLLIGLIVLAWTGFRPEYNIKGVSAAFFTGVTGILGTLFFFFALLPLPKFNLRLCYPSL